MKENNTRINDYISSIIVAPNVANRIHVCVLADRRLKTFDDLHSDHTTSIIPLFVSTNKNISLFFQSGRCEGWYRRRCCCG